MAAGETPRHPFRHRFLLPHYAPIMQEMQRLAAVRVEANLKRWAAQTSYKRLRYGVLLAQRSGRHN
eukprot:scaffold487623_cov36-Prasinocladus_malaysianus.AAC.1